MAACWTALVNGQPFFLADTSAYVRGPDFAVVYSLGNKFATSWTQERTLQGNIQQAEPANGGQVQGINLDSPFEKSVLAGRSVYYGALLYISHLTSYMWLAILMQAAIFLYLSYVLLIKCLRWSFFMFASTVAIVLAISPASFFISFLMPDIFASYLILATIILAAFWKSIGLPDKALYRRDCTIFSTDT